MGRTIFLLCFLISCSRTSINGEPDAQDSLDDLDGTDVSCGDCDDEDPCTVDTCNPLTAECEHTPLDADDDGYAAIESPDGTECGGDDCDDSDPGIYPGAPEVCLDGVDQDCDTVIDAFTAVSDDIVLAGSEHDVMHPAIVWTGSEFGVAWWDVGTREERVNEAYLQRVDARGAPVGGPTRINDDGEGLHTPPPIGLAWTGSEYGVVWETPVLASGEFNHDLIEFARFDSDGVKIGGDILIVDWAMTPSLAWTGSRYGVAYRSWGGDEDPRLIPGELFFLLLDQEGRIEGEEKQVTHLAGLDAFAHYPSIAWTGSEFGLIWERYSGVVGWCSYLGFTRLDADGEKLLDDVYSDCIGSFDSTTLVWSGSMFAAGFRSFFSVFDASGVPSSGMLDIDGGHPSGRSVYIKSPYAALWTGSEYGLLADGWNEGPYLFYHTISPGSFEQDLILDISTSGYATSEGGGAWTGSTIGAVWLESDESDEARDDYDIHFRLVGYCE